MNKTTQIINALRFCDENRPRWIDRHYWDKHVADSLAELMYSSEAFDGLDAWWAVMERVRTDINALPEVSLKENQQ